MADAISSLNQVLYNSPQVSSLVGGHQAAEEETLRQARVDQSRLHEDELAHKVMAGEKSAVISAYGDDGEGQRETRRERLARMKAERELRLRAARAARAERDRKAKEKDECSAAENRKTVVDVCV